MNTRPPIRPRDLAVLMLAECDAPPRARARDQQADLVGLRLRREVLSRLIVDDPDASQLDESLARIVDQMGAPTGPARAVAQNLRDDWIAALASPALIDYLVSSALDAGEAGRQA